MMINGKGYKMKKLTEMFFVILLALLWLSSPLLSAVGDRAYASVAYDSVNRRFLSVYSQQDSTGPDGWNIYGQLWDSEGVEIGGVMTLNTINNTTAVDTAVAFDSINNRYFIVLAYGDNINGLIVDGDLGNPSPLSIAGTAEAQRSPSVVFNEREGGFLVAWHDKRDAPDDHIYGQIVGPGGTLTGPNFPISKNTGWADTSNPSLAFDSINNRYMAVWSDDRNADRDEIFGQIINSNGTLFSVNNIVITDNPGYERRPSVAFDSINGRYLVVWDDYRNWSKPAGSTPKRQLDLYTQMLDADGSLLGSTEQENVMLNIDTWKLSYDQYRPSVVFNELIKKYNIVWIHQYANITTNVYIYSALLDTNGVFLDTTTSLSNFSTPGGFSLARTETVSSGCPGYGVVYGDLVSYDFTIYGTNCLANIPPSASLLLYPADGSTDLNTSLQFRWEKAVDPDNYIIWYDLYLCEYSDFSGCTPVAGDLYSQNYSRKIAGRGSGAAGIFILAGSLFLGILLRGRKAGLLLFPLFFGSLLVVSSLTCNGGSSSGNSSGSGTGLTGSPADARGTPDLYEYYYSGLKPATTYYWKVKAYDKTGGVSQSETWSFTTR